MLFSCGSHEENIRNHFLYPFIQALSSSLYSMNKPSIDCLSNTDTFIKKYRIHKESPNNSSELDNYMELLLFSLVYRLTEILNIDAFDQMIGSIKDVDISQPTDPSGQRRRPNFSCYANSVLSLWIASNPDPVAATKEKKEELSRLTGLTVKQVSTWLVNKRRRDLKYQ